MFSESESRLPDSYSDSDSDASAASLLQERLHSGLAVDALLVAPAHITAGAVGKG